jgi:hypothetical protein
MIGFYRLRLLLAAPLIARVVVEIFDHDVLPRA